ncbi:trypsin-like peptidase domain-containing protein [Streptomyces griseoruber]|uniref:trypsin-like peptidase domain-containing protein n=1 Tax=Streptomyces griseoruber TaxID=1943 RepID=UPI000B15B9D1|nr:trypsin-like peptidase domain-containing protein [Streptomyces griseoruber]
MKRNALLGAIVLLALTSASEAAADGGSGPLGVTTVAAATRDAARVGALFQAADAGHLAGAHFCTASVVHAVHHNLLVTAAHCLSGSGALVFVPGYRDGKAPYGVWKVARVLLPAGWAKAQDEDSDVAFATVAALDGREIEDVVGADRLATRTNTTGATAVTVTGYPNSHEVPIRCTNHPTAHSATQQRITCPDFTGGTSGSPWINGENRIVGILGGHEQGGSTADISYSVVLGDEAVELYEDASSAPETSNPRVMRCAIWTAGQ